jgi:hypothetical protein
MRIKNIQVPDNSNNKKWDNDFKIYLNPERAKTNITITRVKSARKKDSEILPSSAIKMIKKKIKFKKEITAPKISRFNKYIQRAVEKDLLKARKSDFHTVTLPNFTPVTILKLKAKKAAVSILPKSIHSSSLTNSNGRAPAKAYTVISRKFKNKIKTGLNIEKLLTIIMST